ncbi:ABC transporter permease [Ottowia testudinis]|uniref:ABC transporter permease n=1 Tax=Ottowia testudinis TaxID=2816950 RepID=A0A975CHK3_9BURK|nr:ABC transporter permease [Ottowia testudinis]QTD46505.1 ABC transporter permease [Ottowia testudinis]
MFSHISTRWRLAGMSLPAVAVLLPFLLAVVLVARFSFSADTQAIEGWTGQHYAELSQPFFMETLARTFKLAAYSTVICVVLAVPLALLLAAVTSPAWRRLVMCLVLLPMILNLLIQSYGWMMVLGAHGIVNRTLMALGLAQQPVQMLFNEFGVLMGMVQTALPLAVFPILAAMRGVQSELIEAASSLGATPWRSFVDVTLPLLRPGLVGAASIVFAFNASAFAVPLLLGGRRVRTVGTAIRDMVGTLFDWAGAAAAGVVLIVITFAALYLAQAAVQLWQRKAGAA